MNITYLINGNTMHINIIGELDEHEATFAKRKLDELISQFRGNAIIIDMARLSFMDSTGIGVLIGRYKLCASKNIKVYISNASRTIDKVLSMSGIYQLMHKVTAGGKGNAR